MNEILAKLLQIPRFKRTVLMYSVLAASLFLTLGFHLPALMVMPIAVLCCFFLTLPGLLAGIGVIALLARQYDFCYRFSGELIELSPEDPNFQFLHRESCQKLAPKDR